MSMKAVGTIVTGASSNHFHCLQNLLASVRQHIPDAFLMVYDLGLTAEEQEIIQGNCNAFRTFDYSRYPQHVDIRINAGQYAWKPILIEEVLEERGGLVLWLDAGNLVLWDLVPIWTTIRQYGVVTPRSSGPLRRWTHPGTLRHMSVPAHHLSKPNRNGAIVGFNADCPWARQLSRDWKDCALSKECIAPEGSSRENHRQDQAVLSVLYYRYQECHPFRSVNWIREISTHNDQLRTIPTPSMANGTVEGILRSSRMPYPIGYPSLKNAFSFSQPVLPTPGALRHLVVVPQFGLGNRLRAIASAKRLAQMAGARCSVYWDWPDYEVLFEIDPEIEILSELPSDFRKTHALMWTKTTKQKGTPENRRVPLNRFQGIVLYSCHSFCAENGEKPVSEGDLLSWLPQPSAFMREKVEQFKASHFGDKTAVGMHIRRTDNRIAIRLSPDESFFHAARTLRNQNQTVFLATDNQQTEDTLRAELGDQMIVYPKNPKRLIRWPRKEHSLADIMEDYADLLILASCHYVLGSACSSFSALAMALNRSPSCRAVGLEKDRHFRNRRPIAIPG
jgi:hypothetical protein